MCVCFDYAILCKKLSYVIKQMIYRFERILVFFTKMLITLKQMHIFRSILPGQISKVESFNKKLGVCCSRMTRTLIVICCCIILFRLKNVISYILCIIICGISITINQSISYINKVNADRPLLLFWCVFGMFLSIEIILYIFRLCL